MENNKRMKVIVTPFNILEKLFEKQAHVRTTKDFWNFAEEDLLKGLYWEELYNKVGICKLCSTGHAPPCPLPQGRRKTDFKCPSTDVLATEPCPVAATNR